MSGHSKWATIKHQKGAKDAKRGKLFAKLARQIPNLTGAIRQRVVISPADLEKININLVGGDPYAGSCAPDQFFILRPLPGLPHHRTPIAGLYHIGASTHPGPGLHGASGLLAAKDILGSAFRSTINPDAGESISISRLTCPDSSSC